MIKEIFRYTSTSISRKDERMLTLNKIHISEQDEKYGSMEHSHLIEK